MPARATWWRARWSSSPRRGRSRWTTGGAGGPGRPAPTGATRSALPAASAGWSGTRSCTCPTRALAYAAWAGKELPTEIEWEYAARAGRPPTTYAWGEEFTRRDRRMANTWNGQFPWQNLDRRHERTSPVGSYPGNAWGLVDMIGNVWEWTCSPWTPDHTILASAGAARPADNPAPAAADGG